MADVVKYPGNGTDGGGSYPWTDPGNICAADGSAATNSAAAGDELFTNELIATNFGFSISSGSTINGIMLEIYRKASLYEAGRNVVDGLVRLLKNGNSVGNDKAGSTYWGTSYAIASYGGSTDLWGVSWTPADINGSGFGACLAAHIKASGGTQVTAYVDYMRITVYYTEPPYKDASASLTPSASVQMQVVKLKQAVASIETSAVASITGNVVKIGGVSVESYSNLIAVSEKAGEKDVQSVITPCFYVIFIAEKRLLADEAIRMKMKKEVLYTG